MPDEHNRQADQEQPPVLRLLVSQPDRLADLLTPGPEPVPPPVDALREQSVEFFRDMRDYFMLKALAAASQRVATIERKVARLRLRVVDGGDG